MGKTKKNERLGVVRKAYFFFAFVILASLVVVGKIIQLQLTVSEEEKENLVLKDMYIIPQRGDIYSSDGKLLATSVCYYNTSLDLACEGVLQMTDSAFEAEIDSLSACLSKLFKNKTKQQYKSEIYKAKKLKSRNYSIMRKVSYLDFEKMRKFPFLKRGQYGAGFKYEKIFEREKPFGKLARRTIGEMKTENRSSFGLEDCYDSILGGKKGFATHQKVAKDVWVPLENSEYIKPENGKDVISTIDIGLQDIAERALEKQLKNHDAKFGTVVVMEVKTGKVRAIANLKRGGDDTFYEHFNYAVANVPSGSASDPGSTFKIASVIVAMEDGYITPESEVYVGNGTAEYFGKTIRDSHTPDSTYLTVQRIIETSSNVGTARFVYDNYKNQQQKFVDGIKKLHLNERLGVDIRGEATPVIHEPHDGSKYWSKISLPWMAYGYGISITPLQILAFYNAIANDGKLIRPMFIEALSYRGEIIETFEPYVIDDKICSQKTIDAVKLMLEGVVQQGTAINLKNQNYPIAGKTGTAQMNYGVQGQEITYHASFVGYFPSDNPEYSCIVSIYNPSVGSFYGNVVAGNVFRDIADKIYSTDTKTFMNKHITVENKVLPSCKLSKNNEIYTVCKLLNIPNNLDDFNSPGWVKLDDNNGKEIFSPMTFANDNMIPSVKNMGASDAIELLEKLGLNVVISGRGKVVDQNPIAGTVYTKGSFVYLTLN